MTEQNYDKLLDASVSELPKQIKPKQDLWAGIDHAIERRENDKKSRRTGFLRAAAVAVVALGTTWFFSADLGLNQNDQANEVTLSMLATDIDKGFRTQKANILAAYEGQPALTVTWQDQLQELEVARSGIWEALKKNPNNVYMIQMLLEVQQQQLDLIESAHVELYRDI